MVPEIGILPVAVAGFAAYRGEFMGSDTTRSKEIIAALQAADRRVSSGGFAKAIAAAVSPLCRELARGIIPDGYLIDEDERQVVLYEVADTHPIRPAKADKIADLYDELEQEEWTLRVVVLDYTSHVVADVHGWAFGGWFTSRFAPPNCLDMTPAARAAADEAHKLRLAQDASGSY